MTPITINHIRYYQHQGRLLPSSTSILKETSPNKGKLLGWLKHHGATVGLQAAHRGTLIHEAMGYILKGDRPGAETFLQTQDTWKELQPFCQHLTILDGMEAINLEQSIYGPRWAGTYDALVHWQGLTWILEIKTVADPSKLDDDRRHDWALQAYSYGCLCDVDGLVIIMVSPHGATKTPILKTDWEPLALAWNDRLDEFYRLHHQPDPVVQAFQW